MKGPFSQNFTKSYGIRILKVRCAFKNMVWRQNVTNADPTGFIIQYAQDLEPADKLDNCLKFRLNACPHFESPIVLLYSCHLGGGGSVRDLGFPSLEIWEFVA